MEEENQQLRKVIEELLAANRDLAAANKEKDQTISRLIRESRTIFLIFNFYFSFVLILLQQKFFNYNFF